MFRGILQGDCFDNGNKGHIIVQFLNGKNGEKKKPRSVVARQASKKKPRRGNNKLRELFGSLLGLAGSPAQLLARRARSELVSTSSLLVAGIVGRSGRGQGHRASG